MFTVARLAAKARRCGAVEESECEALPRLSALSSAIIELAEQGWQEEQRVHGGRPRIGKVLIRVLAWPALRSSILLTLRGCGNAFALPWLVNLIVEAVVQADVERATRLLVFLLLERVLGACCEYWGVKAACTEIPTDFVVAVAGLVVEKAAKPGLMGMQDAGVDPSALVGRELAILHAKASQMLPNGLIALPTLIAGCVTLFFLLGWSAIFGVAWVLSTIRLGIMIQERAKQAEGRMAVIATERLGILGNVMGAIKAIKYFAWEPEFCSQLLDSRNRECLELKVRSSWTALAVGVGKLTPITGSLATFVAYALLGHELRAGTIFAANSVFMTLRFSVGASGFLAELYKSTELTLSRVDKLLALPERPQRRSCAAGEALAEASDLQVSFRAPAAAAAEGHRLRGLLAPQQTPANEVFRFSLNGTVRLAERGKLTAICGEVGSGKSILLSALLGNVEGEGVMTGDVRTPPDVGWCPQKAFIISGSIEDNILLGRPRDQLRLERCLADACLGRDLELLGDGLAEVVGERGTTLSGGQQARVGLARAYYGDPSLLLLDDPLAAVDAAVGRALLQALRLRCAGAHDDFAPRSAECPGAVVVLNQLPLLPNFDQIVFIKSGRIEAVGTFDQVHTNPDFKAFMHEIDLQKRAMDAELDLEFAQSERRLISQFAVRGKKGSGSRTSLVKKETTSSGFVRWAVWRSYIFAPGQALTAFMVAVYVAMYITLGIRDWWMTVWADDNGGTGPLYLSLFVLFSMLHVAVVTFAVVLVGIFAGRAGRNLHSDCIRNLLHAPMAFFDETPVGRITSRLGPDLAMVDNQMAMMLDVVFTFSFMVIMMCATVVAKIPVMAIIFVLAFLFSFPVVHGLLIFRQDTKRHSNNAFAPVLSNLSDIRRGALLIDALKCGDFFKARHRASTDHWSLLTNASTFTTPLSQSWCHLMHLFVLTATGILTFSQVDALLQQPALIAMFFSYAALWGIFAMVTMGSSMGLLTIGASLERLVEFKLGDLPQEKAWKLPSDPAAKAWPCKGSVRFEGVQMRYRVGAPLALQGLDLHIAGGEKVGVVGRTGAGKSSMTAVLFRLVECEAGRVVIDDIDIASIGLHTLRKAISMIPQEPIVMDGTIRYNLDPFGQHGDKELLDALQLAGLLPAVTLDTLAGGVGAGLSAGQKQLVTFGRTLLQDTRVVVMDEPTASVDMQTDRQVQHMSREIFANRTVLTIAHRLDTVRHCDRIAVLDAGRIVELGPPSALFANASSRLSQLAAADSASPVRAGGAPDADGRTMADMLGFLGYRICSSHVA